jgi:CheY-like chemotaxis protein
MMTMLLESRGYKVRSAGNGAAALKTAREFHPNVVLMDLGLPDMSGHDVVARLKEIEGCQQSVLIALSGRSDPKEVQQSLDAGFHHHVVKPADIDQLEKLFPLHVGESLDSTELAEVRDSHPR